MAVSRGGLEYTIKVENQFSGPLRDFRSQVAAIRSSFRDLRNVTRGIRTESAGLRRELSSITQATRKSATEQRKASREAASQRSSLAARRREFERLRRESDRLSSGSASRRSALRQEVRVVRDLTAAYTRLSAARLALARTNTASLNRALAPPAASGGGGGGGGRSPQAQRQLTALASASDRAEKSGNRLLFTFRRLFGVLAAFTAARLAAQGIADLVRNTVEFDRVLESASLGIASLISASGGVSDALGGSVGAAQQLALAQKEAARQTLLLRRDGLKTAATFAQLVDTFQIAVGPGLAAGLDLDRIRKFTVQVSQAAAAAGVAQNQLSEEIRSILSGTIQQRTTRLAAVLGITNEDIRSAKEAGVLVEFLDQKFSAFREAGEQALGTFDALFSNASDAISQLLGSGGLDFFKELKALLSDTIQTATQTDPLTELVTPRPQGVAVVRALFTGLQRAVAEARRLQSALGFGDLGQQARVIGSAVGLAAESVGRIIEGFVKGAGDLSILLEAVTRKLREVTGLDFGGTEALTTFVRLATVVGGLVLSFKLLVALAGALNTAMAAIAARAVALRAALLSAQAPVLVLLAGIAAVALGFRELASQVAGVRLGLVAAAKFLSNEMVANVKALGLAIEFYLGGAFEIVKALSADLISGLVKDIALAASSLSVAVSGSSVVPLSTKVAIAAVAQASNAILRSTTATSAASKANLKILEQRLKAQQAIVETQRKARARQILSNREEGVADFLQGAARGTSEILKDLRKSIQDSLSLPSKEAAKDFSDLNQVIDGLAPTIARTREGLDKQAKLSKSLANETLKSSNALEAQRATVGLLGSAQAARLLVVRSEQSLLQRTVTLVREQTTAQSRLEALSKQRESSEASIAKLGGDGLLAFRASLRVAEQILNTTAERGRLLDQIRINSLALTKAQLEGNSPEIGRRQQALAALREEVSSLESRLSRARERAGSLLSSLPEAQAQAVGRLVNDRLSLLGKIKVAEQEINEIQADRAELARIEADNLSRRLESQALQATQRIGDPQVLALEAQAAQRLADLQRRVSEGRLRAASFELATAQEAYRLDLARYLVQERQTSQQERALQLTLAELRARESALALASSSTSDPAERAKLERSLLATQKARIAVAQQLGAVQARNAASLAKAASDMERARVSAERLKNLSGENGFFAGLTQRAKDELTKLPTAFDTTFSIIQTAVNKLSAVLADTIVDALDPTEKVNLKERFAEFFKSLSKQILEVAIQAALLRVILGTVAGNPGSIGQTAGAGAGGGGSFFGFAEGGIVPGGSGAESPSLRPIGVARSDTVPAWLTPGETVIPRGFSSQAGYETMQALVDGLIDPLELRALAGVRASGSRRLQGARSGYAQGGVVSAQRNAGSFSSQSAGSPSDPSISQAVVRADDQTMERLLKGGSAAMLRFIRQNRRKIGGYLQ